MSDRDEPARWSASGLGNAAIVAFVSLGSGAFLGYLLAHEPPPQPQTPTLSPSANRPDAIDAEAALLAPLRKGDQLGGYDAAEILPIGDDGVLQIVCKKMHATVQLNVSLARTVGASRFTIAASTEGAPPSEGERLATALAAILDANSAVPIPPKMVTTIVPR